MAKLLSDIDSQEVVEALSDYMHEVWSNWYRYQRDNSTSDNIDRWNKQQGIKYSDLSEIDKGKDRIFAYEILKIIKEKVYQ